MNISLPDSLKPFVDDQVSGRGYGSSSGYVRELIRSDRDRQRLREQARRDIDEAVERYLAEAAG